MAVISGGTTLIDNGALDAGVPTGDLILLSTQTASASASISFTSGIDSTYDSYVFKFINIHPSTDNVNFTFNMSTDSGSNYNVTKTSTSFRARHDESDTSTDLIYLTGSDLAQSTSNQIIAPTLGADDDQNCSGYLQIFNPSSNTFVKHFSGRISLSYYADFIYDLYTAGYGNITNPVDAIQFKMSSGNIDSGTIKMYGVV